MKDVKPTTNVQEVVRYDFRKFDWVIDSGTEEHICNERSWFEEYETLSKPVHITGAGTGFYIVGIGKLRLTVNHPNGSRQMVLTKVAHVPQMPINLLSVAKINENDTEYRSIQGTCAFYDRKSGAIIATGTQFGSLWKLDVSSRSFLTCWSEEPPTSLHEGGTLSNETASFFNNRIVQKLPIHV